MFICLISHRSTLALSESSIAASKAHFRSLCSRPGFLVRFLFSCCLMGWGGMACLLTYVLTYGGYMSVSRLQVRIVAWNRAYFRQRFPLSVAPYGSIVLGLLRNGNDRVYVRTTFVQRLLAYSLVSCGEQTSLCHISSCLSTCLEPVSDTLVHCSYCITPVLRNITICMTLRLYHELQF
jgi:hypothetical protein